MTKNKRRLAGGMVGKSASAFKYADLGTVLVNLPPMYSWARHDPEPRINQETLPVEDLRAIISRLESQVEQLADRFGDELERLAERFAQLEERAHRPWWRRTLFADQIEPAGPSRRRAVATLRALSLAGHGSNDGVTGRRQR